MRAGSGEGELGILSPEFQLGNYGTDAYSIIVLGDSLTFDEIIASSSRKNAEGVCLMSDFNRIRPAISHFEQLARAEHGANFVLQSKANFSYMMSRYYSKDENPDYAGNIRKFCYLYKYSVAHGYYIYATLKRLRPKIRPSIFSRNPTRIACVGGGPGTEIIGLCRYLREVEAENLGNRIEVTIFDKEPSWEDSCRRVLACVADGLQIDLRFQTFDATVPASYADIDFSGFHLVMANFFASEIRKAKIVGASKGFWQHMFASMGAGKIFVALDFADAEGIAGRYIDGIIPPGATTVLSDQSLSMTCPDSKASIAALEAELDHRPKKMGQNLVRAVIT